MADINKALQINYLRRIKKSNGVENKIFTKLATQNKEK